MLPLPWQSCWVSLLHTGVGGQGSQLQRAELSPVLANQPHSTLTFSRVALVIFRHCWELPGLSHLRRFHSFLLSPVHHPEPEGLFGCWMGVPRGLCSLNEEDSRLVALNFMPPMLSKASSTSSSQNCTVTACTTPLPSQVLLPSHASTAFTQQQSSAPQMINWTELLFFPARHKNKDPSLLTSVL